MKRRVINIESSYSYKNDETNMTIEEILNQMKINDVEEICIVDYCNCAAIAKMNKLDSKKKIGYGIKINIKVDDLYVSSIILAKNYKGIKALYKIVTKLNEDKCYFISYKKIKEYLNDLILGIREFDINKDYDLVIDDYTYVEVNSSRSKNEVLKINNYCQKNNLLLIGVDDEVFIQDEVLIEKFKYLPNKEEVAFKNSQSLMKKLDNIVLPKEKQVIKNKNISLVKEIYDRAEYVYFYGLDDKIKKRINDEIEILKKYELEGTINLICDLVKKVDRMGFKASIGGWFSNTLVAYILGLTDIDVMNLKKQRNLEEDIMVYGMSFQIIVPKLAKERLIDYFRRLTNQQDVYIRGEYKISDGNGKNKVILGMTPDTYYVIPNGINILDYTPLDYYEGESKKYKICVADKEYLNKIFSRIYFRPLSNCTLINELERITNMPISYIPYNEKKVVKACYINEFVDKENNSNNIYDNYMMPELKLNINTNIETIEELIDLNMEEHVDWLMKVMSYYYLNYYKVHYPEEFYKLFLLNLNDNEQIKEDMILDFEKAYRNGSLDDIIKKEDNIKKKAIMKIMRRMKDLNIDYM